MATTRNRMFYMCLLFHAFLIYIAFSATTYLDEDCVRLRKPFHQLSEYERMLYVSGYQALRKNGKLAVIATAHAANVAVHKGASFFFLHAYMIWEAETAIRELGDEYKCFSMPYWDYTRDSGLESDPTIFHLNVGADGDRMNDYCMNDPLWSVDNYWSVDADTCFDDEQRNPPHCCLKRSVSDTQLLPNAAQIASVYIKNSNYLLFETQIDHYHVWPHFYLAVNTRSQMATAYAVDDPLFFLLHTFTLYQRALWTTCYEYDEIDITQLQNYPDAYTPSCNPNMEDCGVVGIDARYNLYPMDETDWALASKMDITPRKLYDITQWNVQYDLGDFYYKSRLNEWCSATPNKPNTEWFVDSYASAASDVVMDDDHYNPVQAFIDETWMDLKSRQSELGLSDEEIYFAVESMSCKYHRETSENSCYDADDDVMSKNAYATCESEEIDDDDVSLEDMLQLDGVRENECLIKRRKQIYGVSNLDHSVKLKLCNGEYDYQCPDWTHPNLVAADDAMLAKNNIAFRLQLVSSYDSNGYKMMLCFTMVVFVLLSVFCVVRYWLCQKQKYDKKQSQDIENELLYGTFAGC